MALAVSQEQLAASAGLTTRTVQTAEAGRQVSLDTARSLATALGVPLAAMMRVDGAELERRLAACGCAVPPPPRSFAGRRAELAALGALLSPDAESQAACLTGASGIGKTSLARAAVQGVRDRFEDGVVWIPCGGEPRGSSLLRLLVCVADALGLAAQLPPPGALPPDAWERAFAAVFWRRPRLLVLDDVQDAAAIGRLAPPGGAGRLLVTTSLRSVAREVPGPAVSLGPLPDAEALELLRGEVGDARIDDDPDGTAALVARLGAVPRSLAIAGGHLRRHRYLPVADYLALLDRAERSHHLHGWRAADLQPEEQAFLGSALQLVSLLSGRARAALAAFSLLGGRPFTVRWAEAAAGLEEPLALAALSELADVFLLEDLAPGAARDEAGPFVLDSQSQRVAALQCRPEAWRDAFDRLCALAVRVAAEGVWAEGAPGEPDRGQVALVLDRLAARLVPDGPALAAARTPAEVDALACTPDPEAFDPLRALIEVAGRRLALLAPVEAAGWLSAGLAAARATGQPACAAELAGLLGHAHAHRVEFAAAREWYERAAEAHAAAGQTLGEGLATLDLGRMTFIARMDAVCARDELARGQELLAAASAPAALRSAADVILAAATLHAPDDASAWDRAQQLVATAVGRVSPDADDAYEVAVWAVATLGLAVLRGDSGEGGRTPRLLRALAQVRPLMEGDDLDLLRLAALGRSIGLPPEALDGLFGPLPTLRSALLECPADLVGRRVIRLHEIAHGIADLRLGPASPFRSPRMRLLVGGTTITDVAFGRDLALADYAPPLIMPLEDWAPAWTAEVHEAARAFTLATLGPASPLLEVLALIDGAPAPTGTAEAR